MMKVVIATEQHLKYCQEISETIAEAARDKDSGLALRAPEYLAEKISAGNAVIALDDEELAGFCYIQPWEHDLFVAHSGLIVKPEFRGRGLARELKAKAFELTRLKYPSAKVFGLTTSPAVRKVNLSLGYSEVPYSEITADLNFCKGCCSCANFKTLCDNSFATCLCTAMLRES